MSWLAFQLENKAKIHKCDLYSHILGIVSRKPNSTYVDVGCFTGVDVRRIASDGWPQDQVIGIDGNPAWFELGWKLFKDKETSKIQFITLDIMEPADPNPWGYIPGVAPEKAVNTRVISAFAFFHLFSESRQVELAKRLWGMLEKQPGNVIVGIQKGMDVPTLRHVPGDQQGEDVFFCHSPESWKAMWLEHISSELEIKAHFENGSGRCGPESLRDMYWSVKIG